MISLITFIQQCITDISVDTFSFYYGEKGWNNLMNEDTTFPLASVDFIPSLNLFLAKSGYIGEEYPVTVFFGHKSELDWTTLQHESVIGSASQAARQFISALQNYKDADGNKYLNEIKFVSADRVILRPSDDAGTSGVLLKLLISPNVNLSVCV